MSDVDSLFDRDKFLLRQKHWSLNEKYYVTDEQGTQLFFVERPRHLMRSTAVVLLGTFGSLFILFIFCNLTAAVENLALEIILIALGLVLTLALYFAIVLVVGVKRHITFFKDDSKQEQVMEVIQEEKLAFPNAHYTVNDAQGVPLARLQKNYLYDLYRKQWRCYRPDGQLLCVMREDQLILALLRRFLGTLYGILRTNFVLLDGTASQNKLGEFNRKFTILDRYVLDLSADQMKQLDRRIALAIGVLLDTGERR